jgi:hypothetical protein
MYAQPLHHIHLPLPFPHLHPLQMDQLTPQAGSVLHLWSQILFRRRIKRRIRKRRGGCREHFLRLNIATQGVFLWHFLIYMYYSTISFISIFYISALIPFYGGFNSNITHEIQDCKIGTLCGGVQMRGGWMKEIKVSICGWCTSYTYMKQNKETSCSCFKWRREGVEVTYNGGNVINV